jgi:multicomponent Na+:H+ antiporter subunit E
VNRVIGPLGLLAVWLLLWGEVTVANVASGLLVVAIVVAVDSRLRAPSEHTVHPHWVIVVVVDLLRRLVAASWTVVLTVLAPTEERLRSGVVRVELRTRSPLVATVVADLISLTPGTLTLDVRDGALLVHVLGLGDPDAVRHEVHALERLVLRAFTPLRTDGPELGTS